MDLDFLLRAVQVAKVKYMNEIWGNFRLIEGTKTLELINSGRAKNVEKSIMDVYIKNLSPEEQLELAIKIHWPKIEKSIRGRIK